MHVYTQITLVHVIKWDWNNKISNWPFGILIGIRYRNSREVLNESHTFHKFVFRNAYNVTILNSALTDGMLVDQHLLVWFVNTHSETNTSCNDSQYYGLDNLGIAKSLCL